MKKRAEFEYKTLFVEAEIEVEWVDMTFSHEKGVEQCGYWDVVEIDWVAVTDIDDNAVQLNYKQCLEITDRIYERGAR